MNAVNLTLASLICSLQSLITEYGKTVKFMLSNLPFLRLYVVFDNTDCQSHI